MLAICPNCPYIAASAISVESRQLCILSRMDTMTGGAGTISGHICATSQIVRTNTYRNIASVVVSSMLRRMFIRRGISFMSVIIDIHMRFLLAAINRTVKLKYEYIEYTQTSMGGNRAIDETLAILYLYTVHQYTPAELSGIFKCTPEHIVECLAMNGAAKITVEYGYANSMPEQRPAITRRQYKKLKHILQQKSTGTSFGGSVMYYTGMLANVIVGIHVLLDLMYFAM